MNYKSFIFLLLIATATSGCASLDPAAKDLKSPCAAAGDGIEPDPCVRRKPVDNFLV